MIENMEAIMAGDQKRTFFCPSCNAKLSFLEGTIIKMDGVLKADKFSVRTQFYFPAKLGQYGVIIAGSLDVKEGAEVEFHCIKPTCNKNFTAAYNPELAEIRMVDEAGREFVVIFNKIYGKRSTFLVDPVDHKLLESHGDHAGDYSGTFDRPLNYFGAI